ncbi:MAG: Ig-like domain-containing protein [Candidatus Daviesbacteria bacterium]|nr:Ig-like domain-containing protein [Candidatus Daviesbacteria bacterium]
MKQSKTIYLVFALLGIVILIILVQVIRFSEAPKSKTDQNIEPIDQFIPPAKFKITSTNISDQPFEVDKDIRLIFEQPVDNESLNIKISPEEKVVFLFNSNLTELTITPTNAWDFNTRYTIKVSKSTKSQKQEYLDKDYEFYFETRPYGGI